MEAAGTHEAFAGTTVFLSFFKNLPDRRQPGKQPCETAPFSQISSQLKFFTRFPRGTGGSRNALPVGSGSSMRHCRLRIMRITSKPLIVADAVGSDLKSL